MSETTTLEQPPETIPVSPADDEQTPVAPAADGSVEQPPEGGLEQQPPEVVTPLRPRTPQEVDNLLRTDPSASLTAAEVSSHYRWQQSVASRREMINQQRSQSDTVFAAAKSLTLADAKKEVESALLKERDVDWDHIEERLDAHLTALRPAAEKAVLASHDADVEDWLMEACQGDTATFELVTKGKSLQEKRQTQLQWAFEMGRNAGPDPASIVLTQAELDSRIQAAVNASRAANPQRGASVGSSPTSIPAHDATWLNSLPIDEYAKVPDSERAAIWAAEQRRRAS